MSSGLQALAPGAAGKYEKVVESGMPGEKRAPPEGDAQFVLFGFCFLGVKP